MTIRGCVWSVDARCLLIFAAISCAAQTGCAGASGARGHVVSFDPRPYYSRRAIYVLHGECSWYADSLAGHSTASGEPYEPEAFTAAHRKLPFGTILRVVRPETGQWVLVRVNDRGPYAGPRRILDLSKAAARKLFNLHRGVADVDIEVLELGQKRSRHRAN